MGRYNLCLVSLVLVDSMKVYSMMVYNTPRSVGTQSVLRQSTGEHLVKLDQVNLVYREMIVSFVLTPSVLALATASLIARVSGSDPAHCSQQCDLLSYCDDFENKCKPCSDICKDGSDLSDCRDSCAQYHYLHNIVAQTLQTSQLHVLTIMVTLTAIMSSVIMILLMVLMRMKMKKKRVMKKVTPSVLFTVDHKMGLNDTKMEPLGVKGNTDCVSLSANIQL